MEIVDAQIHEPQPTKPVEDHYGKDAALLVNVEIARRILTKVRSGVSIGIDIAPLSEARFETMYRRADQALYKAKGAGRNRYVIAELDIPSLPA